MFLQLTNFIEEKDRSLNNDPNHDSFEKDDYNTARTTENQKLNNVGNPIPPYSPDNYSCGNILEQIENESVLKGSHARQPSIQYSYHNLHRSFQPQDMNENAQYSILVSKHESIKETIRQYIEK